MEFLLCILAGVLVAGATFMMLDRNMVKFLFGIILLSNAANLVIFAGGRVVQGRPAFIPDGAYVPPDDIANALPQALILTAIVIGFGLLSYALVLAYRSYQEIGTVDMDEIGMKRVLGDDQDDLAHVPAENKNQESVK